MASFPGQPR